MRICVCGGREYANEERVFRALDAAVEAFGDDIIIINGDAKGADSISTAWAYARDKQIELYPADWKVNGRSAGPIRNRVMLKAGFDILLAFPGGRGTADMVSITKKAGIPVREIQR